MTDDNLPAAPLLYLADAGRRATGEQAELERSEARHVRALRLAAGDPVRLTDGRGALRGGRLTAGGAAVELLEPHEAPPPLDVDLWAPVGNKQATLWLVEKAAEFGLRRLRPVAFERSASVADAGRSGAFWAKAQRRALAAVKQSGSAWAPEIDAPAALDERLGALVPGGIRIVLDRPGLPLARVLAGAPDHPPPVVVLGPEGGLTDAERAACRAVGFRAATLGPNVLRFETAAVAALAIAAQREVRGRVDEQIRDEGTTT